MVQQHLGNSPSSSAPRASDVEHRRRRSSSPRQACIAAAAVDAGAAPRRLPGGREPPVVVQAAREVDVGGPGPAATRCASTCTSASRAFVRGQPTESVGQVDHAGARGRLVDGRRSPGIARAQAVLGDGQRRRETRSASAAAGGSVDDERLERIEQHPDLRSPRGAAPRERRPPSRPPSIGCRASRRRRDGRRRADRRRRRRRAVTIETAAKRLSRSALTRPLPTSCRASLCR